MPGIVNVNWKVCPGLSVPESNMPDGALGEPLVTVCCVPFVSELLQITVVPTLTVIDCGLYIKFCITTLAVPTPGVDMGPGVAVSPVIGIGYGCELG